MVNDCQYWHSIPSEPDVVREQREKNEWPKWFEWHDHTVSGVLYLRFDSPSKFASFDSVGAPHDDGTCWKMSDAEERNYWHPIPGEPDIVRKYQEENEWPKYVLNPGGRVLENLVRLVGPDKKAVYYKSDGTETKSDLFYSEYFLNESGRKAFPSVPTAEAEAMIATAKENEKPTERYWVGVSTNDMLWRLKDGNIKIWSSGDQVWTRTSGTLRGLCNCRSEISPAKAEAIMAGGK